jgi:predicted DNA-binding transcriptional regulator YafY
LWFVAQHLGFSTEQKHRALSDVELTWSVFMRLAGMLREKGIHDFKTFLHLFSLSFSALEDVQNQKIAEIQEAIDLGARLRIKYLSTTDAQMTRREVIPREIRRQDRGVYLIGFCCLRNEERTFKIDHIVELEAL